ncbi:MAG: peptidylprolyl isomerase, partial [Vicinamibacterales bacterium]
MSFRAVITGVALVMTLGTGTASAQNPVVVMDTSLGSITIELDQDKAPISVDNFLQYANDGFYEGTVFHRVIPSFMIQGGGSTSGMSQKTTADGLRAAIKNEAENGLLNERGTLAMARTPAVDSATAQFFINQSENNGYLNH